MSSTYNNAGYAAPESEFAPAKDILSMEEGIREGFLDRPIVDLSIPERNEGLPIVVLRHIVEQDQRPLHND